MSFIAYCLSRRHWSKAQILQDLWVCFELDESKAGFFVEFGALDGKKNSNTWLLENRFGWSGILAEPNPIWHSALASGRNAHIEHKCVSSRSGEKVIFLTTNDTDPELSGIAEFCDGDHFGDTRRAGAKLEIETISLDDLLEKFQAPSLIDYISIDTEGSELDILSSFSFNRRFRLMSVEANRENEAAIEELLTSKGYKRVFKAFSQWDSWYVLDMNPMDDRHEIAAPDA